MTIVTCSPTLNVASDLVIGESPRWRGLRRNFCRVFSMIPFEALTISSPAVVHVEDVELEHLARRTESFREGRPRPAPVPVDPLLDVGPGFRGHPEFRPVSLYADDLGREQPSSPYGIRAPVNNPPRRALGDRLADQNRERPFKLCFVHGRRRPEEHAVRLRGAVLLQGDDVRSGRRGQLVDLHDPGGVHASNGCVQVDPTFAGLLDLDDERSPAAEHPGVDVLAAHAVQGVAGTAGFPHNLRGNHLLDARRVHLTGPPASGTPFAATTPARPARLRHSAGELAVAACRYSGFTWRSTWSKPVSRTATTSGQSRVASFRIKSETRFPTSRLTSALIGSGPVSASSAHRDSSRAASSKSIFEPIRNVSNSQGSSFRATSTARSSYRAVRPPQTQQGSPAMPAISRTAPPRSAFASPCSSFPKSRPRHESHTLRSPSARQSTERAAARISSTVPEGNGALKVHASRTTLMSRFVSTIAVIKTYARSLSSANESRLSSTRATGVKINTRTPRFRKPAGVKWIRRGPRDRGGGECSGIRRPVSPARMKPKRRKATDTTTPPRRMWEIRRVRSSTSVSTARRSAAMRLWATRNRALAVITGPLRTDRAGAPPSQCRGPPGRWRRESERPRPWNGLA